jgi:hypothetical protein
MFGGDVSDRAAVAKTMAKRAKRTDVDDGARNNRKTAKSSSDRPQGRKNLWSAEEEEELRLAVSRNSPNALLWLQRNGCTFAVGIGLISVLFMFLSSERNEANMKNDHRIPVIDRLGVLPDPERDNRTMDFLINFVCNYKTDSAITADAMLSTHWEGYCHRRLSAEPHYRTQRVSFSQVVGDESFPSWWEIIRRIASYVLESSRGGGIPAGELVMRLPRPLQVRFTFGVSATIREIISRPNFCPI